MFYRLLLIQRDPGLAWAQGGGAEAEEATPTLGVGLQGKIEASVESTVGNEELELEGMHPTPVALKMFFTSLDQFSNRAEYVDGDPRYRGRGFSKQSKRKMIKTWAEKEYRNLTRVHRAGMACPQPILQKEHLLLMTFIGRAGWPAPQVSHVM